MKTLEDRAARWFWFMGLSGLIFCLVFFIIYVFNLIQTGLPPQESMLLWNESSAAGVFEFGPGWFLRLGDSYVLSSAALAFLVSSALPPLIMLSVCWFRCRDYVYGSISLFLVGTLLFAMFFS